MATSDSNTRLSVEFIRARQEENDRLSFSREDGNLPDHHRYSISEIQKLFGVDPTTGLSSEQVLQHRSKYGPNVIIPPGRNWIKTIFYYTFGGFNGFLWFASVLSWIAWGLTGLGGATRDPGDLSLAVALLVVAFFNVGITAYQEYTSSAVMKSINAMVASNAMVWRDAEKMQIPASELVPGDIIELSTGDRVPADVRIISVNGLKVDQSMLTGESEPVTMRPKCTSPNFLESKNMTFSGGNVVEGSGTGMVISIGNETIVGSLAKSASLPKAKETYLAHEIRRSVIIIASLCALTALACFIAFVAWLRTSYPSFMNWVGIIEVVLGLMIAYLPEGLPLCVILSLLIIAKRMARNNVLVKDLTIIETLGSINIIASDKTGTLTQNRMSVCGITLGDLTSLKTRKEYEDYVDDSVPSIVKLILGASLCNGSNFDPNSKERQVMGGGATDCGILRWADALTDVDIVRSSNKQIFTVPFNSKTKYMITINQTSKKEYTMFMKGAAEKMLARCSTFLSQDGTEIELTEKQVKKLLKSQTAMCEEGQRVLGLISKKISPDATCPFLSPDFNLDDYELPIKDSFTFLGFIALQDPPREEVRETIRQCHEAGIKVAMVTGDHPLTAVAIARMVGVVQSLPTDSSPGIDTIDDFVDGVEYSGFFHHENNSNLELLRPESNSSSNDSTKNMIDLESGSKKFEKSPTGNQGVVITGEQILSFDDRHWDWALSHRDIVFARTSPENKLEIVKQMQQRKLSVAVTGDGVNDSPALRQADVGVAMGGGSDVAKEAGSVILTDNNFKSLLVGIENGRLVFANLKKVFRYLLPAGTFSEILPVVFNVFLGLPAPLSSFLMIYICVITDVAPCISMVFESAETDVMKSKPRHRHAHLLDGWIYLLSYGFTGVAEAFTAFTMFFYYMSTEAGIPMSKLWLAFDKYATSGSSPTIYANPSGGFYTGDQLDEILKKGQTVYFVTLIVIQFGNLLGTRSHKASFFSSNICFGSKKNRFMLLSIPISLTAALILVYIPGLNHVFNTRPVGWVYWFLPIYSLFGIFVLQEIRKFIWRRFFPTWWGT